MKKSLTFLFALFPIFAFAQVAKTDSIKLDEVTVKGYYNTQSLLRSVASVSLIDSTEIRNQPNSSLVSLMNTVPGVRMEERSPGSYRVSLRGSLLRSPFGIRNIKIYFDDFPLTDAGGNSYLNSLDFVALASVEVYKGPEANIYGANTGGAVLIKSTKLQNNQINGSISGGSFGLFHQTASLTKVFKNYRFNVTEGYQTSDGYRDNSAMNRKYLQTTQQLDYNKKGSVKFLAFYSDLAYQTPGGLTALQLSQNPRTARPATPTLPGAITQQAGIYNKTLFAGLSNNYQLGKDFKHIIAVYTSYTDFRNPFITNYEKRYESNLGLRTFLAYSHAFSMLNLSAQIGAETAENNSRIKNFDNNAGEPAKLQASDYLKAAQSFGFLRLNLDFNRKLNVELASSLNLYRYGYERFFPTTLQKKTKNFNAELMPKIALSYLVRNDLAIRGSISKGYSPPTIAEVRASDNNINTNLQAEFGWNYEIGLRYKSRDNRLYFNTNVFQFNLQDAIVRKLNQNETEYFENTGATNQKGIELEGKFWVVKDANGFIKDLKGNSSYALSKFKFGDFPVGKINYSGNKLTGVPEHVFINSLEFLFQKNIYFFAQHNHTSAIPVNDANTVTAKKYDLVDLKIGKRDFKIGKTKFELYFGMNNVLNEKYSLGNDLNAVAGRYFNAAASRNFYTGILVGG
ncbi:TonB-dependent receptor [Pedobacter changchengzhani]|uniref:TonB-dependent receptor n=1 Tax=Pedobacter changchengzhani TaxID=2529274 RepID=A0A4R5MH10_9SPHI|nr:TonB-dependent receptor [Pedobacter changchengzhani]TDG34794.1 TonB-dependent receptor [Pedobacter changchengzhani]